MRSASAGALNPGEDDGVDSADADGRQHEDGGLEGIRHVDREAVALADAHAAQCGCRLLHAPLQLGVGEHLPDAALAGVDERRVPASARRVLVVDAHVGEVGLPAHEPAERGVVGLVDGVPRFQPGQLPRGAVPERFRVLQPCAHPVPDNGVDDVHVRILRGSVRARCYGSARVPATRATRARTTCVRPPMPPVPVLCCRMLTRVRPCAPTNTSDTVPTSHALCPSRWESPSSMSCSPCHQPCWSSSSLPGRRASPTPT